MIFEPFGDFDSAGYLRNTLGLKNPDEVKESSIWLSNQVLRKLLISWPI